MSFFNELRQRNVLRVAAAYIVASWLVIQVVETLFPVFGLSDVLIRVVVIVLAVGFVPVLILAWVFELTPEGLKLEKDIKAGAPAGPRTSKKLDRVIMVVLALALGYFAFDKFVLDPARDADFVEEITQDVRTDALLESYGDKSIAVLPFVDMSANGDQEYMSDGIAEELLNLLAKIPELRVVSRSSAFAFKGKEINIPSVAEQLNVAYILEGSVRQAGEQLRITAQLIEAKTDTHLWSETFDRKLENIFVIQDEISAHVVEALKITLLGAAPKSQQINEQAYKMALQARYFWNRRAEGDADAAFDLYQKALELAPEYAPAWAGISVAYRDQASNGNIPKEEALVLGRQAAEKAMQLDPDLADAHIRMGQYLLLSGDNAGGKKAFETALKLEPNNSTALGVMANTHLRLGEIEKAIELLEKAVAVDPMGALWPGSLVDAYIVAGRYEDAREAARRTHELNGNDRSYLVNQAMIYIIEGRHEEILLLLEGQTGDWPGDFLLADAYSAMAVAYHALGRQTDAETMINKIDELDDQFETLIFTQIYALQGDLDTAFLWIERAAEKGFPRYYIEFDPYMAAMQNDPRWEPVLNRFRATSGSSQ